MKRISFAWTTPAIRAKVKTCTRRFWNDEYAQRFNKGDIVQAVESNYRKSDICPIRLTEKPYKESTADIPETDYQAEGFAYLESIGAKVKDKTPKEFWDDWKRNPVEPYVVRFEYV